MSVKDLTEEQWSVLLATLDSDANRWSISFPRGGPGDLWIAEGQMSDGEFEVERLMVVDPDGEVTEGLIHADE